MSGGGFGANVNNQNPTPYQKSEKCTPWNKQTKNNNKKNNVTH